VCKSKSWAGEVDPIDLWATWRVNSLRVTDFFEQRVRVRQMNFGHVFDERAHHFVVANPPVDPADENHELYQGRKCHRPPVGVIDDTYNFGQEFFTEK
jgi:hypothetical protein